MASTTNEQLLHEAAQATASNQATVSALFDQLSENVLTAQPAPGKWSALECIDHITLTQILYNERIAACLTASPKMASASARYRSGLLGRFFIAGLKPTKKGHIRMKMKTFGGFVPASDLTSTPTLLRFQESQQRFVELLAACAKVDLQRNRIASAAKGVSFQLGDGIKFVLAHTERHLLQAERAAEVGQNIQ